MPVQHERKLRARKTLGLAVVLPLILASWSGAGIEDLSDPQVAHAAVTANRIDVEAAELALEKAETPEVRAFAEAMAVDHEAVIEAASALAERLGVTPEENEVSSSLLRGWRERRRKLEKLEGSMFEERYMEGEVVYHEAVVGAVRETLIPAAENADLRALLEGVVPALEGHLNHARMVREKLNG